NIYIPKVIIQIIMSRNLNKHQI
ncbi:hypothetical protein, partial [Plasmodium yoelii yoelii]